MFCVNTKRIYKLSNLLQTVVLKLSTVSANWTGATVVCQAALNGGTVDSAPATVDVRYLRQPHVVDSSGQGPVLIPSQGYRYLLYPYPVNFCNDSAAYTKCNDSFWL